MKMDFGIAFLILIFTQQSSYLNGQPNPIESAISCQHVIASNNQGIFQNQLLCEVEQADDDNGEYILEYRSPGLATLLAVFPGLLIHGIGHFYAGDGLTGTILLGIETLSAATFIGLIYSGAFSNWSLDSKFGFRHALYATSIICFFGSWIYDIAHADVAARRYNRNVQNQIEFGIDQHNTIKISFVFFFN